MITLKIDNIFTYISGDLSSQSYRELEKVLSFRPQGYAFSPAFNRLIRDEDGKVIRRAWDGWKRQCWKNKRSTYFPTGLISLAVEFFNTKKIPFQYVDLRVRPPSSLSIEHSPKYIFRDYQDDLINKVCNTGRGIIRMPTGGGKCLGRGTPVLMWDGTVKKVEQIVVGDLLMGPDSRPRRVLSVTSGIDNLYKITPKRGTPFIVNESHILSLRMTNGSGRDGQIVNISVREYLAKNRHFKHCAKGYRVGIDFEHQNVLIDPYFLGVWLGDGRSSSPEITATDSEIIQYLHKFAHSIGLSVSQKEYPGKRPQYAIVSEKSGFTRRNLMLDALQQLGLIKNKHVPLVYKRNSKDVRLQVLAGLMDTGASLHNGGYDYVSKVRRLADDVAYLARSVGLHACVSPCKKTCKNSGKVGNYFRVSISGNCSIIPVKITYKKASERHQKKNCLNFGFEVQSIGKGEYFGFEIDGDRLFLLGDFTVTHNTVAGAGIIESLKVSPFIFFVTSIDLLMQAKESFEDILRSNGQPVKIGQIGAGVVDIADINVMTVQTAVRALGKSWKQYKYDDDDTEDDTDITEKRQDICELIRSAKGSICDEVQHWRADTCQLVARELKSAYYTYGMSATPYRDFGDDMMIQACFGKIVYDISASELIEKGWLIRPSIKMLHIKQPKSVYHQWQSLYKDQVVENQKYNSIIASIANKFSKAGRLVLVLVQQIQHGKDIANMIDGAVFLSGKCPKKQRQDGIKKLRNREISCIVSTTIFDEGIDVRPLDTLLLAGQGKSKVRAMQRVGRVMRPFDDGHGNKKSQATVVDFCLHQKYLKDHAKARLKMYATEPLFQIEELDVEI